MTPVEYLKGMMQKLDTLNGGSIEKDFEAFFESMDATVLPSPKKDPDEKRPLSDLPESSFRSLLIISRIT